MASNRRLQVGLAIGFGLLASTAACEESQPTATIGEPAQLVVVVTSLVTVTTSPTTIPLAYVDDCVEFVQLAAYLGFDDMAAFWDAAGMNVERLRENCISLGRGDPAALADLSKRLDDVVAYLGTTTSTATSTGASTGGASAVTTSP